MGISARVVSFSLFNSRNQRENPYYYLRNMLAKTPYKLYRDPWFQNIATSLIIVPICGAPFFFMSSRHSFLLGCAIIIPVVTWVMVWHFWNDSTVERVFSAKSSWSTNSVKDGPKYWLVRDDQATPIAYLLQVYFTNLRSTSTLIYSSWIEQAEANGSWSRVGLPFGSAGTMFSGIDRKEVVETTLVTFESAAANRNIAPNETIHGWVFFPVIPGGALRLCITNEVGEVFKEPMTPIGSHGGWPVGGAGDMAFSKVPTDISKLPIVETSNNP